MRQRRSNVYDDLSGEDGILRGFPWVGWPRPSLKSTAEAQWSFLYSNMGFVFEAAPCWDATDAGTVVLGAKRRHK